MVQASEPSGEKIFNAAVVPRGRRRGAQARLPQLWSRVGGASKGEQGEVEVECGKDDQCMLGGKSCEGREEEGKTRREEDVECEWSTVRVPW